MKKLILSCFILTIFIVACNQQDTANSSTTANDDKYINLLIDKYNEYYLIHTRLEQSSGSGEDVRSAYYASQDLIKEISNIEVPSYMNDLKNKLMEGIRLESKGVGCYSNKSICDNDVEATILLLEGKMKLSNFIKECNDWQ